MRTPNLRILPGWVSRSQLAVIVVAAAIEIDAALALSYALMLAAWGASCTCSTVVALLGDRTRRWATAPLVASTLPLWAGCAVGALYVAAGKVDNLVDLIVYMVPIGVLVVVAVIIISLIAASGRPG